MNTQIQSPTGLAFPSVVDNSILSAFRSCMQKGNRTYFEHWKPKAESIHLVAGAAFAKGLEVTRRQFFEFGAPSDEAITAGASALIEAYGDFQCPSDSAKSLERMLGALDYYFEVWPLESDEAKPIALAGGQHGIEFAFAEPLPVLHPVTGDPILYSGRADMVCDYAGGIYIEDDKTTSSLGASWAKNWDLRSQFTGYVWAAKRVPALQDVKGVLVRGVSILKTKYDHAQALTYRADWEVDRWLMETKLTLARMIQAWQTGYWSYNLDDSCTSYGGCPFVQICKSPDPETWLPMYFEPRIWDPLSRKELRPDGSPVRPEPMAAVSVRSPGVITLDTEF